MPGTVNGVGLVSEVAGSTSAVDAFAFDHFIS
jgi:hypothetical protein